MNRYFALMLGTLMSFAGLQGCFDEEQGPGRIQVNWQVEGGTCKSVGITDVRVDVRRDGETIFSESTRCTDGSVLFEDVPVTVYDVVVKGYNEDQIPVYEGFADKMAVKEGETPSTPDGPVVLRPMKATVLLQWSFPNGNSICSFNNVATVEVNVSQSGTVVDIFSGTFPCDPGQAEPDELPAPFEGGSIVISGVPAGQIDLFLFGLSPEGERVYFGVEEAVLVGNASSNAVLVELFSCDGNCI
jgi:hypothetical protein